MKRARYLTSHDRYNLHHQVRNPPPPPPPPKKRNGIREGVRVTVSKLVFPPNSPTVQFDTTPTQSPAQPNNGQCSVQYLYNDLQYH